MREPTAGCPRRFEVTMAEAACDAGSPACSYAEVDCQCVARHPCSGVDPGDVDPATIPHVWSCNILDPTLLREDGCPAMVPSDGGKCSGERVCHYSPYCGGIQSSARCVDRAWQLEQRMISPPPSADNG